MSPDGATILIFGRGSQDPVVLSLNAYDVSTRQAALAVPYQSRPNIHGTPPVEFDPTGTLVQAEIAKGSFALMDPRSGAIREASSSGFVMGPGRIFRMDVLQLPVSTSAALALMERGKPDPLLTLDFQTTAAYLGRFSRDGLSHASDSRSGTTVTLMQLPESRRLNGVGLGGSICGA